MKAASSVAKKSAARAISIGWANLPAGARAAKPFRTSSGMGAMMGVSVVPGDGAYLLCEHGSAVLTDPLAERLLPLLDGKHDLDSVAAALAPDVPADGIGREQLVLGHCRRRRRNSRHFVRRERRRKC